MRKSLILFCILIFLFFLSSFAFEINLRVDVSDWQLNAVGGSLRELDYILGFEIGVMKPLNSDFYFHGSLLLGIPLYPVRPYGGIGKYVDPSNLSDIFDFSKGLYIPVGLEILLGSLGLFGEINYDVDDTIEFSKPDKIIFGFSFVF